MSLWPGPAAWFSPPRRRQADEAFGEEMDLEPAPGPYPTEGYVPGGWPLECKWRLQLIMKIEFPKPAHFACAAIPLKAHLASRPANSLRSHNTLLLPSRTCHDLRSHRLSLLNKATLHWTLVTPTSHSKFDGD
jgi:hypothetical protein